MHVQHTIQAPVRLGHTACMVRECCATGRFIVPVSDKTQPQPIGVESMPMYSKQQNYNPGGWPTDSAATHLWFFTSLALPLSMPSRRAGRLSSSQATMSFAAADK